MTQPKKNTRRNLIRGAAAAMAGAATTSAASAAPADDKPVKKVYSKSALFSGAVTYGNLVFIAGKGAHVPGDIKVHTKIVLDEIEKELKNAGSSMEKVLKVTVFLAKGEDYAAMNEVFKGRFGSEPPVRTTVAAAWVPGDSLVEMDVIAFS